ncbi:MAG: hypothetical protein KAT35_01680, partial [Candidatus Aenigmarchaeota archaeon]|nr:hypothetical protein [Candidatus Aenigmarchaeota archaeon]
EEVLNLEKLRDDIQELRADKENLYKTLDEESSKENERLDILKQSVRRKIESVTDQFKQEFRDLRKAQGDHIKSEVNQAFTNLIDPRFTDTEKNQVIFDEKLKRLGQVGTSLEKRINSIEAPENVRKWLEGRVSKLERGLVSDISGLQGKSLANSAGISKIAEDLKMFRAAMADVPKRLGNQGNMINKLLDTKDYFVSTSEVLGADLKALSEKLSTLQASHAGLDQRMSNQESRFADSLNKQRDYLTTSKDDLSRHLDREISSIRKTLEKKGQEESRSTLAEFKAEIKRLSSTEEEIKAMRRSNDASISRLQKQVADLQGGLKEAYPELKLMETRLAELDNAYKGLTTSLAEASEYHKASDSVIKSQLMKYVEGSMKSLKKEIEERRNADAKAQLRE